MVVLVNLLHILQVLPTEAIGMCGVPYQYSSKCHELIPMCLQRNAGMNALPGLTKIRFVAAELLNQLEVPVDGHASSEQMAERQRAYEYLSLSRHVSCLTLLVDRD